MMVERSAYVATSFFSERSMSKATKPGSWIIVAGILRRKSLRMTYLTTMISSIKVELHHIMAENRVVIEVSSDDENKNNIPRNAANLNFFYNFYKILTASQVQSAKLHLPANFVKTVLVHRRPYYLLEDEQGVKWSIHLSWSDRSPNECDMTSGWEEFKRSKNLVEGSTICIGPRKKSNTIYIKCL